VLLPFYNRLYANSTFLPSSRRFGPGPHEVEFKFKIANIERSFVVEMAPIDLVPHAVHLFLEQVEHKLWNGAYFYINGPHVIQAGAELDDGDEEVVGEVVDHRHSLTRFEAAGLDALSFPDYSESYPHVPWTLGYAGRPGGVDWYINKVSSHFRTGL
jgi:hypothetical protein